MEAGKRAASTAATSYSAMSVGEVESIGAHCETPFCRILDFLPFKCASCNGKFCLDHRTESAHACLKAGAWARSQRGQGPAQSQPQSHGRATTKPTLDQQCSSPSCKTLIHTALAPTVYCRRCRRSYCLKHRLEEEHGCAKVQPAGLAASSAIAGQRDKGLAALQRLREWGLRQKEGKEKATARSQASSSEAKSGRSSLFSTSSKRTSPASDLLTLRRTAKGDDKVPADQRVYLHVEASADTTTARFPTGPFFYSKSWSVGRVLDVAAKALQVENVNNHGDGEANRLRVFHVEGGRLLDFPEKIGQVVASGNTIVLLRGVGPPVPDLIGA